MRQTVRLAVVVPLAAAAAIVAGIQLLPPSAASADDTVEPARLVPIAGTDRSRVVLEATAATRLDLQTATVREGRPSGGAAREVIPYAALLYDAGGRTFAYVRTAPLTFERTSIVVAAVTGDRVLVAKGLAAGSAVVTVGAAELIGIESGVDEE